MLSRIFPADLMAMSGHPISQLLHPPGLITSEKKGKLLRKRRDSADTFHSYAICSIIMN